MCTGITLTGHDGTVVYGRTNEWGGFDMRSRLAVAPRAIDMVGSTPDGEGTGMVWRSRFGFVGLDGLDRPFILDGLNEAGFACGAFYLPGFAEYRPFDPSDASISLGSLEVTHYLLSMCESTEDVAAALGQVQVIPVPLPDLGFAPPLHYLATDRTGNSMVIEYVDGGELKLYDNPLGVITNAPEFDWHLTNLRNYINLSAVELPPVDLESLRLAPLGAGSGMLGLPGDNTPPSRFVRAVAHAQTARATAGGLDTVKEVIRILDNFQLAVGAAEGSGHSHGNTDLPASTQWTTAADTKNLTFYYHTAWNRRLRRVDLSAIGFDGDDVAWAPLDAGREEDIEDVTPRQDQ